MRDDLQHKAEAPLGGPPLLKPVLAAAHHEAARSLPVRLTSFIGRESELTQIRRLLAPARLLTLLGAPGVGKTRLAAEVGARLLSEYPDGVHFVELARVAEPSVVPQAVARVLGIHEQSGRPLTASLVDVCQAKGLLLILDNCEHLAAACAALVEALLRACPRLTILATSREPLLAEGETAWRVPPLAHPDPGHLPPLAELVGYEALRLLAARAVLVQPDFAITAQNARAAAELCQRLDGIPLAIELAAARLNVLTVEQIVARLGDRFHLLTGGRTALPHHRTLRALIEWSHGLLSTSEQVLLHRLAVFVGGWTLEAAEAVGAGRGLDGSEVLDLLAALVDKSLVLQSESGGAARYGLLETIRAYGLERPEASGEAKDVRRRHRDWFLAFAERAAAEIRGPRQAEWLTRLEGEDANLRAALAYNELETDGAERAAGAVEGLAWPWVIHGHVREGRRWVERLVARAPTGSRTRMRLLASAGYLAERQGETDAALPLLEENLALAREQADARGIATALSLLGALAQSRGDLAEATRYLEESAALYRRHDVPGDRDTRVACFIESPLVQLAGLAQNRGSYARAQALYDENPMLDRAYDDRHGVANSLRGLAWLAHDRGDAAGATSLLHESLGIFRDLDDKACCRTNLELLAHVAVARGESRLAARLLGVCAGLEETTGVALRPALRARHDRAVATARTSLGKPAFSLAWAEGRAMPLQRAIELGLSMAGPHQRTPDRGTPDRVADRPVGAGASPLSPRELEVAELVARGMTNREIGVELVLAERTVDAHVRHILDKLGATSRAQIAAWAVRSGLVVDPSPPLDR